VQRSVALSTEPGSLKSVSGGSFAQPWKKTFPPRLGLLVCETRSFAMCSRSSALPPSVCQLRVIVGGARGARKYRVQGGNRSDIGFLILLWCLDAFGFSDTWFLGALTIDLFKA
jgi:hypothetical protein